MSKYLDDLNLKKVMANIVAKLLREKPDDAFLFMSREFAALSETKKKGNGVSVDFHASHQEAAKNYVDEILEGDLGGDILLRNPRVSKGLGFDAQERKELSIQGLLPNRVETQAQQEERNMWNLNRKTDGLDKYQFLMGVLDANEKLFYSTVINNIKTCMPIVYTPIVGKACQELGHIWTRPRGMYITIKDLGNVRKLLDNWGQPKVKAIVFTDGQRILGLGDLGAFGMGIPIGKLALYTACAGLDPKYCLPVTIDVGTNTQKYLEDPLYFGLKQKRDQSEAYDQLIQEFLDAAADKFGPTCILQFEDFGNANAFRLLAKHRDNYCTFNDDVQGTAAVTLAGIFSCMRATKTTFTDHKFLFFGAGSAGLGIANLLALAISQELKIEIAEARKYINLVDSRGLVYADRKSGGVNADKADFAHSFAGNPDSVIALADIVKEVKPTAIIGVSAQAGVFSKEVCETMASYVERPIIFPLSNPTHKAECTAELAYTATKGKCVFASGSPFDPVEYEGKTLVPGQGNNAFIFPGLALGALVAGATRFPDELFMTSAKALSEIVSDENLESGNMYPLISDIRAVSLQLAESVAKRAYELGVATAAKPKDFKAAIAAEVWDEKYIRYVE
jgi:malate dehydrogenase (oxaloacetate-decarboxylating)(NADP+)